MNSVEFHKPTSFLDFELIEEDTQLVENTPHYESICVSRGNQFDQDGYEQALRDYVEDMKEWKSRSLLHRIFKFYNRPIEPNEMNFYIL